MTKSATMSQKMTLFSDSVPSQLKAKSLSQTEHHKGEKKNLEWRHGNDDRQFHEE